jgi:hypothetical protein
VEKYGGVGQATDDNMLRRMRIAFWVPNATNNHAGGRRIVVGSATRYRLYGPGIESR